MDIVTVPASNFRHRTGKAAPPKVGGDHQGTAMSDRTIDALRRRLEKWELQHLRALAAELATRLERLDDDLSRARDESSRAWESSEFWQRNATDMQLELMEADYTIGLTKDGQVVFAKNGGAAPGKGDQPTFILCGPQAAGKTRAAAQIAAGLGCAQIIDDWNGKSALPAGALAITNGDYVIPPGGIVLHVEDCAGMTNLLALVSTARL